MSSPIRAAVCGKGKIAMLCIDILLKHGVEILAVIPDFDDTGEDSWRGSVLKHAKLHNLLVRQQKLNTVESIRWLQSLNLDYLFSFQYYEILRPNIFAVPKQGTINLHFAPLPKYRGCYPIAWALLNGEQKMGVSLHYIDEGIDTGDIVAQRFFSIPETYNARMLFDRCIVEGGTLFEKALPSILRGTNARTPQNNSKATYYDMHSLKFSEKQINWNREAKELNRWIRAFVFPPLQFPETRHSNVQYLVASTRIGQQVPSVTPGSILQLSTDGITVATSDGVLVITELVRDSSGVPLPLSRVLPLLRVGDIFSSPLRATS